VSFLLTVIGVLLLIPALLGVALGAYMAVSPKMRESGLFFALWWVPAVAAAGGIMMQDTVTFTVGAVCWVLAGIVLIADGRITRPAGRRPGREHDTPRDITRSDGSRRKVTSQRRAS
jgi:hypothetical protein